MLERQLWMVVMRTQQRLGLDISDREIAAYQRVIHKIDLESIREREYHNRHDLKARLEEFSALARVEKAHLGMTSADVVENVMLIRMQRSLFYLDRQVGLEPPIYNPLGPVARSLPFRGIKGPVGTQQDQLDLLGSPEAVETLDREVAAYWGFDKLAISTPQVMHRSIDLQVAHAVASSLSWRPRHWLHRVLRGYVNMVEQYQGDTWNEGDVSTSAVRRVALPGIFFAADAILEESRPG